MIVHDPLYGAFALRPVIARLAMTPEVRRLSQVRLLNTLSPSLAVLSDLRRYSHTLGVVRLSQLTPLRSHSALDRAALEASALIHDVATPPFGHILEYLLQESLSSGWHHEVNIAPVVWGSMAPEDTAHQIFGGRQLEFQRALERGGIPVDLVDAIVRGGHPLSKLLFGSLDLDNLDNVARMTWALGERGGPKVAETLARHLDVNARGELLLPCAMAEMVMSWLALRRQAYEILVFDPPTVASQAVLAEALLTALTDGYLTGDSWDLYDEELLERLRRYRHTKRLIISDYLGELPRLAVCLQFRAPEGLSRRTRQEVSATIKQLASSVLGGGRTFSYVFEDRGTFGKRLDFVDPESGEEWALGETTRSTIIYAFLKGGGGVSEGRYRALIGELVTELEIPSDCLLRCLAGPEGLAIEDEKQQPLAF